MTEADYDSDCWYMVIAWVKYTELGTYFPTNFLVSFEADFMPGRFVESIVQEFDAMSCVINSWTYVSSEQRDDFIRAVERERLLRELQGTEKKKEPHLHIVKGKPDES